MENSQFDYINVIPLVDILMVLLTIVLMTSTFVATGSLSLELPQSINKEKTKLKHHIIEIDHSGVIYYQNNPTSVHGLQSSISSMDKDTPFIIRADKSLELQSFVDVLDAIKQMHFTKISLQTNTL